MLLPFVALSLVAILKLGEVDLQFVFQDVHLFGALSCLLSHLTGKKTATLIDEADQLLLCLASGLKAFTMH